MGLVAFLILGLIAGAIAKQLLPGVQGGGVFMTMLLGAVSYTHLTLPTIYSV